VNPIPISQLKEDQVIAGIHHRTKDPWWKNNAYVDLEMKAYTRIIQDLDSGKPYHPEMLTSVTAPGLRIMILQHVTKRAFNKPKDHPNE